MTVAVITDSTACLTPDMAARAGLTVVPIHVVIDGRSYRDGVDITSDEVAAALSGGSVVSTSKPTPQEFLAVYTAAAQAGATEIVSVHVSAALSGTYDSARLAAREASVPVTVVDSHSIVMGLGFAAMTAAEAVYSGADAARAAEAARLSAAESSVLFYVDTLEFLRRGGRIGKASAWLGGALRVKPLLHVDDGVVAPLEKARTANRAASTTPTRKSARTANRALGRLTELAVEAAADRPVRLAVQHLDAQERAEGMAARLRNKLHAEVVVCEVTAVMGVHVGPGVVAVSVAPA